jgi:hypothetical protein
MEGGTMQAQDLVARWATSVLRLFALALLLGGAVNARSQDCSTVAGNKVGDLINVTVVLQTDDPDENGEGEPIAISSSGGEFIGNVGVYFSAVPFSYVATQANETVSGSFVDSDGDETCSITLAWNQPQFISKTGKSVAAKVGVGLGIVSGGSWTVAELCTANIILGPICGIQAGLIAAVTATAGVLAGAVASDPPDPNFMDIANPVFPSLPIIIPQRGAPQALADAANALLANEVQMIGIERALVTTLNRASGASDAKNDLWLQRQQTQADLLETALAAALGKEATLLNNFQAALTAAVGNTVITADQVKDFEAGVAADGLPAEDIAALQLLGVDDSLISVITNQAFVQDADAVAQFPLSLTDAALLQALQTGSVELNRTRRKRAVLHP